MPSLAEFAALCESKQFEAAMRIYKMTSAPSLNSDVGETVWSGPRQLDVGFDFTEPNGILMRAAKEDDPYVYEIWYLPWEPGRVTSITLNGGGPAYFSTAQMNGCRFTIHYADTSRKEVTVLHSAGRGLTRQQREDAESTLLSTPPSTALTRRYSITPGTGGLKFDGPGLQAYNLTKKETRLVYDGGMAWMFGVRDANNAWNFFAQAQDWDKTAVKSVKPLMP